MKNECFLEFWDNLWLFHDYSPFFLLSPSMPIGTGDPDGR